jgi:hypothetical protein
MATLTLQTIDSAPQGSKATLRTTQKRNGFIPNLIATFASSPALLTGHVDAYATALKSLKFNPEYVQAVRNSVSLGNYLDHLIPITIDAAFRGEE